MKALKNNLNLVIDGIICLILVISYILFAVALFNKHEGFLGISLGIIFGSLITQTIIILVQKNRLSVLDAILLVINFVSTIVFVVVFIYLIEDEKLRDVLVPVVSSLLSGLLTLTGVCLTIKYTRISKEEEEIKKYRPVVFPLSSITWNNLKNEKRSTVYLEVDEENSDLKYTKKGQTFEINSFWITNSDASLCSLFGILVNNKLIKFKYEQVLSKDSSNMVVLGSNGFSFSLEDEKVEEISLLLTDMLDILYEMIVRFSVDDNNAIHFDASLGIVRYKE